MSKATHRGTCQICGAQQKLPNSRLSIHGYTTRWGFFSGTCTGTRGRPFEESYDLIEDAIARARVEVERLDAECAAIYLDPRYWVHEYLPAHAWNPTSSRVWRAIEPADIQHYERGNRIGYIKTKRYPTEGDRIQWLNPGEEKAGLDRKRAVYLQGQVREIEQYVDWQQARIDNWKPGTLQPIMKGE